MDEKEKRNYKDSLFSSIFYTCENADENAKALYKAITGTTVKEAQKCRLEDVFWTNQKNDVSYLFDGKIVFFIEHQSTINENMPFRFLLYVARIYEMLTSAKKELKFREKLFEIPTPEFFVLYNGTKNDYKTELKLSDAFMVKQEVPALELKVKVININLENLTPELRNCTPLFGYSCLVEMCRQEKDLKTAVKKCISQGILVEYLTKYGSEVENMLFDEYDEELARKVLQDEAFGEGKKEGKKEGDERAAKAEKELSLVFQNMRNNGLSDSQIANLTGVSIEKVQKNLSGTPV